MVGLLTGLVWVGVRRDSAVRDWPSHDSDDRDPRKNKNVSHKACHNIFGETLSSGAVCAEVGVEHAPSPERNTWYRPDQNLDLLFQ